MGELEGGLVEKRDDEEAEASCMEGWDAMKWTMDRMMEEMGK